MNGEIETLYERNLRVAIAEAIKKDRAETLRLAEEVMAEFSKEYRPSANRLLSLLKERAG